MRIQAVRAITCALATVATTACTTEYATTIADLDCGSLKLHFEEKVHSDFNYTAWSESLLLDRGAGWTMIDAEGAYPDAYDRTGPEPFTRFLPASMAFHRFPFDERRPRVKGHRTPWAIFVDPARVSAEEYHVIFGCLHRNLAAIDRAFAAERPNEDPKLTRTGGPERTPQISSIIYAPREPEFATCGAKTLGKRWRCADGKGYIKTIVGSTRDHLLLCAPEPPASSGIVAVNGVSMALGQISADQKTAWLWPPCTSCYAFQSLVGSQDPRKYYGTCRDESFFSFLDAFDVVDYQR
jgi:hypothetical protein